MNLVKKCSETPFNGGVSECLKTEQGEIVTRVERILLVP
jgi:hypothetical protein